MSGSIVKRDNMPGRRVLGDGDGGRFGHMLGRDAETVGVCDTCLRHAETFSVLGHRPLRHGACGVSLTPVFISHRLTVGVFL